MKKKYIELLNRQIQRLEDPKLDLEGWKSTVVNTLDRIFDSSDSRIEALKELRVDYGSWALRDATADYDPVVAAKSKGREILMAVIDEIDIFGLPKDQIEDKLDQLSVIFGNETLGHLANENEISKTLHSLDKAKLVNALTILLTNK
jgi:hypothetical protein